jgi:hypothetical protein
MPRDHEARLFHTLVLMGIGLTGSVVVPAMAGCGGDVTTPATPPADAASDTPYPTIGYHAPDASDASYATIGTVQPDAAYEMIHPAPPADASDDSYATIGYYGDAEADAYETIQPAPPADAGDAGADAYPIILPPQPTPGQG